MAEMTFSDLFKMINSRDYDAVIDGDGNTPLILASMRGFIVIVAALLKKSVRIDHANKFGNTALMLASSHGHKAVVFDLLAAGANVNLVDRSAHHHVVRGGHKRRYRIYHREDELLAHGANGIQVESIYNGSNTAIILAAYKNHAEIVAALLGNGADFKKQNSNGDNAFSLVLSHGQANNLKTMLDQKPNLVNATVNDHHDSALILAVRKGELETVVFLLGRGANVNHINQYGESPLIEACRINKKVIALKLLEYGADVNVAEYEFDLTPLMLAADYGDKELIAALLNKWADIEPKADWFSSHKYAGYTPLCIAAENKYNDAAQLLATELIAKKIHVLGFGFETTPLPETKSLKLAHNIMTARTIDTALSRQFWTLAQQALKDAKKRPATKAIALLYALMVCVADGLLKPKSEAPEGFVSGLFRKMKQMGAQLLRSDSDSQEGIELKPTSKKPIVAPDADVTPEVLVLRKQQRFFRITSELPLELQMVLANRVFRSPKDAVNKADFESALRVTFPTQKMRGSGRYRGGSSRI